MFERMSRFETAAEWDRKNLFQMDSVKYSEWLDMAHSTRWEYLDGGLTAEEFLKRIDIYNDLADHMAEKKETPPPQESKWRRKVESSIDFDPETAYRRGFFLSGKEIVHSLAYAKIINTTQRKKGQSDGLKPGLNTNSNRNHNISISHFGIIISFRYKSRYKRG